MSGSRGTTRSWKRSALRAGRAVRRARRRRSWSRSSCARQRSTALAWVSALFAFLLDIHELILNALLLLANQSEVPDLTHPENVALYRTWDQREVAFTQLLRYIRISSSNLDTAIVSRPGRHPSLIPLPNSSSPMDVEAGA